MARKQNPGATRADWARFVALGLQADLLPVVSDLAVPIGKGSTLSALGKTPSLVRADGTACGLAKWTQRTSTADEIRAWSADPRHGICVQTRRARAIDVDIPDAAVSAQVRAAVEALLGPLPCRGRADSGKLLLALRVQGEFTKRILRCAGGAIEFLATGQQFIAVGTHPSGARYVWDGLDAGIPEVQPAEFEELWSLLADNFALQPGEARTVQAGGLAVHSDAAGMSDADLRACLAELDPSDEHDAWLTVGMALHHETQGERFDLWDDWSSMGDGYPGTEALQARWNSFGQRADGPEVTWRTLVGRAAKVAGEEGRTLQVDAYRAPADDFEPVVVECDPVSGDPWPEFLRDKAGRIEATISNATAALAHAGFCGARLGFDAFKASNMIAFTRAQEWRPVKDTDTTQLRINIEARGFKAPGRELVRDAMLRVAEDRQFDSAQQWGTGLKWDGVPRVERCMVDYFRAPDTDYSRAVSLYLWTALAGRLLVPGEEVHMVPVLVGQQGSGKTQGVRALAPEPDAFVEINLEHRDDNLARALRGKLVGELGELRGLQGRDGEAIKAWLSRSVEEWTPKYQEFTVKFPRRVVFIGTTNTDEFLADDTGERRWLPIRVGVTDLPRLRADRDQMWAEAIVLHRAGGVQWQAAQQQAKEVHAEFKVSTSDTWTDTLRTWLLAEDDDGFTQGAGPRWKGRLKMVDVMTSGLRMPTDRQNTGTMKRAASALTALGFTKTRATRAEGGKTVWVCVKNNAFTD